jgi:hypothetical protein
LLKSRQARGNDWQGRTTPWRLIGIIGKSLHLKVSNALSEIVAWGVRNRGEGGQK